MYEMCKKQYLRKIERNLMTPEYIEKQKVYIGIFLMNEQLTEEQYEELLELLSNAIQPKNVVSE